MPDPLFEIVKEKLLEELDKKFLTPMKSIYCYRHEGLDRARHSSSRDFLDSLSLKVSARYKYLFDTRCGGMNLRINKWHGWEQVDRRCKGIFAYKDIDSKTRLVHITDRWQVDILLFGFDGKKEDRVDEVHVLKAIRLRDEYLKRRDALAAILAASQKRGIQWKK